MGFVQLMFFLSPCILSFEFDKLVGFMSFTSGHLIVLLTLWPHPFSRLLRNIIFHRPVSFVASPIFIYLMIPSFLLARRLYSLVHVMDFNRPCYFYNLTYFNETVGHIMDLMTLSFLWARPFYNFVHVMIVSSIWWNRQLFSFCPYYGPDDLVIFVSLSVL